MKMRLLMILFDLLFCVLSIFCNEHALNKSNELLESKNWERHASKFSCGREGAYTERERN